MNAKQKKTLLRSPPQVKKIMKYLPEGWAVKPVHAHGMGWNAELTYKNQRFCLAEDRLYLHISVMRGGQWQEIDAPEDASPKHLAGLLQKKAEELLNSKNP